MKKRLAIFLAIFMVFGFLSNFVIGASNDDINASKEKEAYILQTNFSDYNYLTLRSQGKYAEAMDIAAKYLEEKEKVLKELGIEVEGSLHLVFVGFQVEMDSQELKKVEALDFIKNIFPDEKIEKVKVDYNNSDSLMSAGNLGRGSATGYRDSSRLNRQAGRTSDLELRPQMISSPELIGADEDLRMTYSGKGRLLVVYDNDMYPGHDAFNQNVPEPKITYDKFKELLPLLSYQGDPIPRDAYYSEKVPFTWNYSNNTNDLNPTDVLSGHGQHIAGIMVGKPMNVNGRMWRGVAPNAQIAMMGASGGSMTSAIEHAMILGADAVNISMGTAKGKKESWSTAIYYWLEHAYTGGINIVFAAGNEGDYKGDISNLTPDYGNIDDPAFINNIISVGSIENKTVTGYTVQVDGIEYSVSSSNVGGAFPVGEHEYVYALYGRPEDFEGVDVRGKVALIKRGENFFNDKIENAQKNGAIAVIVFNNVAGEIGMDLDPKRVHIPSLAMSLQDGEVLRTTKNKAINFTGKPTVLQNPKYGEISSFTTYGLTAYGDLKPDLVAPGGSIYSTQNSKDSFTSMSGTSQAAPHVAGSIALLREYMDKDPKFKDIGHEDMAAVVKTLLMNSAVPHMDPINKVTSSPRRQGAGVLDIGRAMEVEYTVVNNASNIPSVFINNVADSIKFDLKFKNYTDEQKVISPSVATTIEAKDGNIIKRRPEELFSKNLDEQKFTLGPKEEKLVSINVELEHLEKLVDFKNGAFIDGYLSFKDEKSNVISFPFASFKGDYDRLSMVEKPLYDFDFDKEHPMYWNYKFEDHPWHRYSTHIETNFDGEDVIAGIKNFSDIKLEGKNRTAPTFEDIVLSPNNDGYYDKLKLYVVATRSGKGVYRIKNSSENIVLSAEYSRHMFQNFSDSPDNKDERYIGYTAFDDAAIEKLDDGLYTLEIGGSPIRDEGKEIEDIFMDSIKFRIDTREPEFKFVSYDEDSRKYVFDLKDDSVIKEVYFEINGEKHTIEYNGFILPENANLNDVTIFALDAGYNLGKVNAEVLKNIDDYGMVKLTVNSPNHDMPLELKYSLKNEKGEEFKTDKLIPNGRYIFKVESYYPLYQLQGVEEFDVVIDQDHKEVPIDLTFTLKENTQYKLYVMPSFSKASDSEKFIVKATSKANGDVYVFDGKTGNYICYLPYGDYTLSYEFRDKNDEEKYIVYFTDEEVTVGGQNSPNWINISEKFDLKINYILNANEDIKDKISFRITNRYAEEVSPDALEKYKDYTVTPIGIPEGYYSVPESLTIKFDDDNLTNDAEFSIFKKGEKKFNLIIKDSVDLAKYLIYTEEDFKGRRENPIEVKDKRINLEAGMYYITGQPMDNVYFVGTDKDKPQKFEELILKEDTEIYLNWKEYGEKKYYKKFKVRSNDSDIKDFTLIIKDIEGKEVARLPYTSSSNIVGIKLKEDAYTIEIPEIGQAYNAVPDKFYWTVYDFNFMSNDLLLMMDIKEAAPVKVRFQFENNGNIVSGLKFKVDGSESTGEELELSIGKHELELPSDDYKLIKSPREFEVNKDTELVSIKIFPIGEHLDPVDKTGLEELIRDCEDLERLDSFKNIDDSKKAKYKEALKSAEEVFENPDALKDEVDEAIKKLDKEIKGLIGDYDDYFKKGLQELIKKADELKENYLYDGASEEVKRNFDHHLKEAKATDLNHIDQVKNALFNLEKAMDALDGKKPLDFSKLDQLLDDYENVLASDNYKYSTDDEKRAYLLAIDDGRELRASTNPTNEKIDDAVKKIREAIKALSGKVFDEKTEQPRVYKIQEGDDKISGKAPVNSTIRVNIDGKDYVSTAVDSDGEFVISVPKLSVNSEINVYCTKTGYLESDPVTAQVQANYDRTLEDLVEEFDDFVDSDYFKISSEADQKRYIDSIELAKRMMQDPLSNDEREDLVRSIESAKKLIYMNAVSVKFEAGEGSFKENTKVHFVFKKATNLQDDGIGFKNQVPELIEPSNKTFIGWALKDNMTKVFKADLTDYDNILEEDITFVAVFKLEDSPIPEPKPEPKPEPYNRTLEDLVEEFDDFVDSDYFKISSEADQKRYIDSSDKDEVPKTGDSTPIAWLFVIAIISGAGVVYFGKKKKTAR